MSNLSEKEITFMDENWYNDDIFAENDDEHPIFSSQPPFITPEPKFSSLSMPPRSAGIQAVGETLQSETSRKISDRYRPTKSDSTSFINPPLLVRQDLHRQSTTSEVGADNGMGLVLFNNDPSSQDVHSSVHRSAREGSSSQIIRKRLKIADGNVIPLPPSIGSPYFPVDQLASAMINPVITFSHAISTVIHDPFQPRDGEANEIPRSLGSFPTVSENGILDSSPGTLRGSRPSMILNAASPNGQVELLTRNLGSEPPISGGVPIATTQRRGNNMYGNVGTLKCARCRKLKTRCNFSSPEERCVKCAKRGIECGPKTLTSKQQESIKTRQPIPGQRIIELDERSSPAGTRPLQECPPSRVSQKEELTRDPAEAQQKSESPLETRFRNLEERVANLEGKKYGGSESGNTRVMENATSGGTSLGPQNMTSRNSFDAGNGSPVSSVSYLNHIGFSSSSRRASEPSAPNYQLTGQFYNVNLERAMHTNDGANWAATSARLENRLCSSCRHDQSGIRIINFADPSCTVALSLPNCQFPQQCSIVLYCLLYSVGHITVHENTQISPRFSVVDYRQGGRHSPGQPFCIDGELRTYNLDAVYRQGCNRGYHPAYRTSPFP